MTNRDRAVELVRHYADLAGLDPDEPASIVDLIIDAAREGMSQAVEADLQKPSAEVTRLLNIARGCHDYNGGYNSQLVESQIYHHGIQTVINALEAAVRKADLQTDVLESIGAESLRKEGV
jgi:hypothetical protein